MEINTPLDELIKKRQNSCDHNYQDRVVTPQETFCGKCGYKE